MNKLDAISDALGAATGMGLVQRKPQATLPLVGSNEADLDHKTARSNIQDIIDQAMDQLPSMFDLTNQAQSDKMYKAAAEMIKTLVDANLKLAELSKSKGQPKDSNAPVSQTNVQQNVYVGSTEDFLSSLKSRNLSEDETVS